MSDKDASTAKVVESMASLPVKSKILLLDVLGQVGGDTALDAVYKSARDPSDEIQDNATRVLGLWMSPDVGPKLLELAKNHPSEKYRIRVMRGYIRIARQLGVTNEERDAMCRQAMQVAERDEEKKLIMEALSRYPSHDGLVIVASQLDSPTLKNDAISRALGIAEIIVGDNPETVARVARQVLKLEPTGKSAERAQALLAEAEKKSK